MRDPQKLTVYQKACDLADLVYNLTERFPRDQLFVLTSQMRRAAISMYSNIAEGCGRRSQADYAHFLDMAFGSAMELQAHVDMARRNGFIEESAAQALAEKASEVKKVPTGLLKFLRSGV